MFPLITLYFFSLLSLISTTLAYPSDARLQSLPLAESRRTLAKRVIPNNQTAPSNIPSYPYKCFSHTSTGLPIVNEADCKLIIEDLIIRLPGVLEPRKFTLGHYQDDEGDNVASIWKFGQCNVIVTTIAPGDTDTFSLLDVAITAQKIVAGCVTGKKDPFGGSSPIGKTKDSFFVGVGALPVSTGATTDPPDMITPSINTTSPSYNIIPTQSIAVSKRENPRPQQQPDSNNKQNRNRRDIPPQGTQQSPPASAPAAQTNQAQSQSQSQPNSTLAFYPVQCFPNLPHDGTRPPANPTDCDYLINQIILRSTPNPLAEQSWGFTGAVDVRLPLGGHWSHNQCDILVSNNDESQRDIFSLMDVALTAGRVVQKCVLDAGPGGGAGGTSTVGGRGRGFFVRVGGLWAQEAPAPAPAAGGAGGTSAPIRLPAPAAVGGGVGGDGGGGAGTEQKVPVHVPAPAVGEGGAGKLTPTS